MFSDFAGTLGYSKHAGSILTLDRRFDQSECTVRSPGLSSIPSIPPKTSSSVWLSHKFFHSPAHSNIQEFRQLHPSYIIPALLAKAPLLAAC